MSSLLTNFISSWKLLRTRVFAALATLFAVRLLVITLSLNTSLGELWRPMLTVPEWGGWFAVGVFITVLYVLYHAFGQLPSPLKNRFLGYYAVCYLLMAFFNNLVDRKSYLYHIFDGRLDMDGLQSLLTMDLFFQSPLIFWSLCWMAITFHLTRRAGRESLLIILWALPFTLINYDYNNLTLVYFTAAALAGLWGCRFQRGESARGLYLFQGVIFAVILFYLDNSPIIYRNSWIVSVILFPLVWVPGYWFIRQCEADNSKPALSLTWLIPLISGSLLSQVLFNAPLAKSLFNFWYLIVSFNFAGSAIITVLAIFLTAAIAGFCLPRVTRPAFTLLAILATLFYLIDGLVLSRNGLRLSFDTIDWVWGLSNFSSILQTAGSLLEWKILAMFLLIPLLGAGFLKHAEKRIDNRLNVFSTTTICILITAQISLTGYQAMTSYPAVLKDPARIFLSSLPVAAYFSSARPPLPELLAGFAQCGVTFPGVASESAIKQPTQRKNIILVMLESTSNQYLSLFGYKDLTWPKMAAYQNRMEIFPFFFSCFPESSNADFSLMSGLYPPAYLFLRQKPEFHSDTLIEKLKKAGYDCSMYFSGFIGDTGLSSFYQPRGLDRLYDAGTMPGMKREDGWVWGIKEHVVIDRIGELLAERARTPDQPFFIYYRNIFPHSPFDRVTDDPAVFPEDDYYQGSWLGRFKNCLLYQDEQLARLVAEVEKSGLRSNTVIVIAGDHGTMLGENGLHGHGWNLSPQLVNVPLIIIHPKETSLQVNNRVGSQVDVMPTLLKLAGVEAPRSPFTQGHDLRGPSDGSSRVFFASLIHRALIEDNHFFLFPIEKTADAMVFELTPGDGPNRFKQLNSWSAEDLWVRYRRLNKFLDLQKHLLTNIESYENELSRQ